MRNQPKRAKILLPCCLVLLALGLCQPGWAQKGEIAVKAGKIIPVVGEPIENGIILVRDGQITEIGKDLKIPLNARLIDASDKVVIPGLVAAHSSSGVDASNERNQDVPYTSMIDSINPGSSYYPDCLRNGITSVCISPGNSTRIGGQAAVVKTNGTYINDMILKRSAGIKISLAPGPGSTGSARMSRMSHLATLRRSLTDIQDYMKELDKKIPKEQPDIRREAMVRLLKGEIPAFIYCPLAMDVDKAIELVKEFKLKGILVLSRECYKAADSIAKSELPVILDEELVFWERDPRTDEEKQIIIPKIFQKAGVKPVFQAATGSPTGALVGTNFMWFQAATAVKYGVPADEALEAITLRPAKILGVEKSVGSLEVGKDADMVILSGDPLDLNTWVETVIVDGTVAYERDKDKVVEGLIKIDSEK